MRKQMVVHLLGQQDLLFMALNKSLAPQKKTLACVLQHVFKINCIRAARWLELLPSADLNYSSGKTLSHQHQQKTNLVMVGWRATQTTTLTLRRAARHQVTDPEPDSAGQQTAHNKSWNCSLISGCVDLCSSCLSPLSPLVFIVVSGRPADTLHRGHSWPWRL